MSVEINETDHDTIVVNKKELFKDANGNWVCRQSLSVQEQNALNNYVNAASETKQDQQ